MVLAVAGAGIPVLVAGSALTGGTAFTVTWDSDGATAAPATAAPAATALAGTAPATGGGHHHRRHWLGF